MHTKSPCEFIDLWSVLDFHSPNFTDLKPVSVSKSIGLDGTN